MCFILQYFNAFLYKTTTYFWTVLDVRIYLMFPEQFRNSYKVLVVSSEYI